MFPLIKRLIAFMSSLIIIISNFLGINGSVVDKKVDNFKVTTYIRGDAILYWGGSLYEEDFDIVTDAIIFECATFNNKGEVIYDEEKMEAVLSMVRGAIGDRDVHLTLNLIGPGSVTESEVYDDQMESQSDEHNKAFESGVLEDNIIAVLEKYDFEPVMPQSGKSPAIRNPDRIPICSAVTLSIPPRLCAKLLIPTLSATIPTS